MVDFGAAMSRPFQDLKTAIIGIILGMIPVVNILTVPGFALRNAKKSLEGDDSLLSWGDWGDIIVKSILLIIIGIIYIIPVVILAFLILGAAILSMISMASSIQGTAGYATLFPLATVTGSAQFEQFSTMLGTMLGAILVIVLLALFVAFILPMAIMHWLKEESFGAAFRFGSVIKKSFTGPYIVAWIFSLAIMFIFFIVAVLLGFIPYVGVFIASGLSTYVVAVAEYTLFAQAYRELEQRAVTA